MGQAQNLPLRMAEPAGHELRAVDDAGVGSEHQVRNFFVRVHELDGRAGGLQVGDQLVPLFAGSRIQ